MKENNINSFDLSGKEILNILGLFFVWRIFLWIISFIGKNRLALTKDQAFSWISENPWVPNVHELLKYWARWDSGWYLSIVERGYYWDGPGNPSNVVFFPLYPTMMQYLGDFINKQYILAGIIISSLCLLVACFYLYKLARLDCNKKTSLRSVFYLLIFPTAIFLASVYTESLFILCAVASFYYARKNKWLQGGIWGFLAALTRPIGVFLIIPLLIEYLEQRKFSILKTRFNILSLIFIPAGLGIYMLYLYKNFGDPLLFIKTETAWNRHVNLSLYSFWQTITTYFHDLIYQGNETIAYYINNAFDLFFFILFMVSAVFVFIFLRKSYAIYMLLGLLIPAVSGTLISMGRYALILFPAFILLAIWGKKQLVNFTIVMLFCLLMSLFTIMFVNSYWVG